MEAAIFELLSQGESIGGYLLIWILWEQHKRLKKLENSVYGEAAK